MDHPTQSELPLEPIFGRSTGLPKAKYRTLQPGEPIPPHTHEMRFLTGGGYVAIQWTVARQTYVGILEHRLVTGAKPGEHVHHRNHIKTDNRIENLLVLTPAEHSKLHAAEDRLYDIEDVVSLYAAGATTTEIGKRYGTNHATILRALWRAGVQTRRRGVYTDEQKQLISERSRDRHRDPAVKAKLHDSLKRSWESKSPEERAARGRRISEAKRKARVYTTALYGPP